MKFFGASNILSLNKSTYTNLRWIAFIGQLAAILYVEFYLKFHFNYLFCVFIIFIGILTNLYLKFKIKDTQLSNISSTIYLGYDIFQLGFLFFLLEELQIHLYF